MLTGLVDEPVLNFSPISLSLAKPLLHLSDNSVQTGDFLRAFVVHRLFPSLLTTQLSTVVCAGELPQCLVARRLERIVARF